MPTMPTMRLHRLACALTVGVACAAPVSAATIVYQNDFNNPVGWVDMSGNGTGLSYAQVNTMFGSQFQQTYTVETIRIAGNPYYSDPSGTGGSHALGMLSGVQDDWLSLTFDVGALGYVNVQMDFALMGPVACPVCGGPYGFAGQTPVFDLRLYDTPGGAFSMAAPGTLLANGEMVGAPGASATTLAWNQRVVSLATTGNTNGMVTVLFDLRAGADLAGYAAFDNVVIAGSDRPGDVTPVPEPATVALAALGLIGLAWRARRPGAQPGQR